MFKTLVCVSALLISVYASGEFTVLHHPSSILFKGHDHIKESLLQEVYSASLGFSTEQDSNWQGMYLIDPFNLAEAVVTIAVDGVTSLNMDKGHYFPLRTDVDEIDIYGALESRVEERNPESETQLVRIDLSDGINEIENYNIFEGIKNNDVKKAIYKYLDATVDEDGIFLDELTFLNAIAEQIEAGVVKKDNVPDVFWFKVSSLHALSDLHGENSTATKEAKRLLTETIDRINKAFDVAYEGRVIVSVITSDASHTRRVRSVESKAPREDAATFDGINLAKVYSENYPVIFNIMLWFSVAMVFSLLAIAYFIADMDPGRDSIIYRMTSTRMKKDN